MRAKWQPPTHAEMVDGLDVAVRDAGIAEGIALEAARALRDGPRWKERNKRGDLVHTAEAEAAIANYSRCKYTKLGLMDLRRWLMANPGVRLKSKAHERSNCIGAIMGGVLEKLQQVGA